MDIFLHTHWLDTFDTVLMTIGFCLILWVWAEDKNLRDK